MRCSAILLVLSCRETADSLFCGDADVMNRVRKIADVDSICEEARVEI